MPVSFTWVSVDARTGVVLADFPDLDATGSLKCVLTQYQTATANLPVPTAPDEWQRATLPGAACLVLLAQLADDFGNPIGAPQPLWGAMVIQRKRTQGDVVELSLATIEAYFDRRFVGDVTFTNTDQNTVVSTLISGYVADGAKPGIPISTVVQGAAGPTMTDTYADASDKTIYSVLSELAGRQAGPEWTVGWVHKSNPERYTPVVYVGSRIGSPVTAGLAPAATFEIPGDLSTLELVENFASGAGATDVMAVSTASGNVRPQSPHMTSGDVVRPTFEYRFTPSTSISDTATLTSHARGALTTLANGTIGLVLAADGDSSPILGTDWLIGDDVGFIIGGIDDQGQDTAPAFPGGKDGVGRAIGWELTLGETWTIAPILSGIQIGV